MILRSQKKSKYFSPSPTLFSCCQLQANLTACECAYIDASLPRVSVWAPHIFCLRPSCLLFCSSQHALSRDLNFTLPRVCLCTRFPVLCSWGFGTLATEDMHALFPLVPSLLWDLGFHHRRGSLYLPEPPNQESKCEGGNLDRLPAVALDPPQTLLQAFAATFSLS